MLEEHKGFDHDGAEVETRIIGLQTSNEEFTAREDLINRIAHRNSVAAFLLSE